MVKNLPCEIRSNEDRVWLHNWLRSGLFSDGKGHEMIRKVNLRDYAKEVSTNQLMIRLLPNVETITVFLSTRDLVELEVPEQPSIGLLRLIPIERLASDLQLGWFVNTPKLKTLQLRVLDDAHAFRNCVDDPLDAAIGVFDFLVNEFGRKGLAVEVLYRVVGGREFFEHEELPDLELERPSRPVVSRACRDHTWWGY